MKHANAPVVALLAGDALPVCSSSARTGRPADTGRAPIANITIDVVTGRRTVEPVDAGARNTSPGLWPNTGTCPDCGGDPAIIDEPDLDGDTLGDVTRRDGSEFPFEGMRLDRWGDITLNSVVARIVIPYATLAQDTDADCDSIGDGIVGSDMFITSSDNDNGFGAGFGDSGRAAGRARFLRRPAVPVPLRGTVHQPVRP